LVEMKRWRERRAVLTRMMWARRWARYPGQVRRKWGTGLGDGATGAQGGWCEFELVEDSVQPDVAYA
jgi:hypothetical protein